MKSSWVMDSDLQISLEILGNLSDESLEGELSDEELGRPR
jgi:hypothetical protein